MELLLFISWTVCEIKSVFYSSFFGDQKRRCLEKHELGAQCFLLLFCIFREYFYLYLRMFGKLYDTLLPHFGNHPVIESQSLIIDSSKLYRSAIRRIFFVVLFWIDGTCIFMKIVYFRHYQVNSSCMPCMTMLHYILIAVLLRMWNYRLIFTERYNGLISDWMLQKYLLLLRFPISFDLYYFHETYTRRF